MPPRCSSTTLRQFHVPSETARAPPKRPTPFECPKHITPLLHHRLVASGGTQGRPNKAPKTAPRAPRERPRSVPRGPQ
eukprot:3986243-Pyramimonas_sp.AAC.1